MVWKKIQFIPFIEAMSAKHSDCQVQTEWDKSNLTQLDVWEDNATYPPTKAKYLIPLRAI